MKYRLVARWVPFATVKLGTVVETSHLKPDVLKHGLGMGFLKPVTSAQSKKGKKKEPQEAPAASKAETGDEDAPSGASEDI